MESGVSVTPWAKSSPATSLSRSQALATKVGCPTDNGTAALVSCLKDQPLDTLMAAAAAVRVSTKPSLTSYGQNSQQKHGLINVNPSLML